MLHSLCLRLAKRLGPDALLKLVMALVARLSPVQAAEVVAALKVTQVAAGTIRAGSAYVELNAGKAADFIASTPNLDYGRSLLATAKESSPAAPRADIPQREIED